MLKILLIAGVILVVAVVALLIAINQKPDRIHYERSRGMKAPPAVIHEFLDNFHHWGQWSPWEKIDPEMKRTYEGPESGVGAMYSWSGNKNIGSGKMTILENKPGELVVIKLEFFTPMAATNEARFVLAPADVGTRVTWSMDGPNNFMGKTMSVFMDMEKMIGGAFEQGLNDLDAASQAKAAGK